MNRLNIGLYGANGHQLWPLLKRERPSFAHVTAVSQISDERIPDDANVDIYPTLEDMLAEGNLELVVLCSPRRADQAADAIKCLNAGKHVYAEKPCALSEEELDAILEAAKKNGKIFHEMADSVYGQPYWKMKEIVESGTLGRVIQVYAQKSYPYHPNRPVDEGIDGGILLQIGIHAARFIEHITGLKIRQSQAIQTRYGCPKEGDLRMAVSLSGGLDNGAVYSMALNYLNSREFGTWGNECVRIFGEKGMLETVDGGTKTRLVMVDEDLGPIDTTEPAPDFFELICEEILMGKPMPQSLEDELHPLRALIRARSTVTEWDEVI